MQGIFAAARRRAVLAAGTYALPRYATAPADAADDQIVALLPAHQYCI
jgi:hypothetical protein